ncbi:hypothetical protein KY342_01100 [Candidatus Woesearchaeota archaeon]|nr:hypothetical protein [Candidatus Woesearchaeota archaeon]
MKLDYLKIIIMVCLLVLVSGCGKETDDENVVENIDGDESSDSAEESEESDSTEENSDVVIIEYDEETGTNADLVAELMKDLVDEDNADEEEEEEEVVISEDQEIVIENFRGDPKDIVVEKGMTVKFTSLMPNFKHVIQIRKKKADNTYETPINVGVILEGETCEYIFEEEGTYQWLSKTNYPVTSGTVTVVG